MTIQLILLLILGILLFFIFLKITKMVIKAMIITILILLLIIAILGFFFYKDIQDFKDKFIGKLSNSTNKKSILADISQEHIEKTQEITFLNLESKL